MEFRNRRCERPVLEMLRDLLNRRLEYLTEDPDAYLDAEGNARLVTAAGVGQYKCQVAESFSIVRLNRNGPVRGIDRLGFAAVDQLKQGDDERARDWTFERAACEAGVAGSDVLVLTSRWEGLPQVLPQAMAYGRNQKGIMPGKLNGAMVAHTPTGWRTMNSSMPRAIS